MPLDIDGAGRSSTFPRYGSTHEKPRYLQCRSSPRDQFWFFVEGNTQCGWPDAGRLWGVQPLKTLEPPGLAFQGHQVSQALPKLSRTSQSQKPAPGLPLNAVPLRPLQDKFISESDGQRKGRCPALKFLR